MVEFRDIARNLLSLEVNTVEKDGMSAQRMPTPTNAIIDVKVEYFRFLLGAAQVFGVPGNRPAAWARALSDTFDYGIQPFDTQGQGRRAMKRPDGGDDPKRAMPGLLVDERATLEPGELEAMRGVALWLAQMRVRTLALEAGQVVEPDRGLLGLPVRREGPCWSRGDITRAARALAEVDPGVLSRIKNNCDQLKGVAVDVTGQGRVELGKARLDRNTGTVFATNDLVLLRKTWDVGAERVLMQTVVQLDGDVVFRIQTGLDDARRLALQGAHQAAVDASFRQWSFLVDTLGRWIGSAAGALLRR
jgi:hypothetical protein